MRSALPIWNAAAVALLSLAAAACGDSETTAATVTCDPLGDGQRSELVDHALWTLSDAADDPWAAFRPADVSCPDGSRSAEDFGGAFSYGVNSAQSCGYTTVEQPLLADVCTGDALYIWLWHFELDAAEPAEAHIAVQIGETLIWERVVPIPHGSQLIIKEVPIPTSFAAGTPIFYHVRNHGKNGYNLLELSRVNYVRRCNGHAALCDRAYDDVAYPTAHNAHASVEEGYVLNASANQTPTMNQQLDDGIRGFMLDTHYFEGTPHLCHGECTIGGLELGKQPLVPALRDFGRFLDDNPDEIITFILEPHISVADTVEAFEAADLVRFTHAQRPGAPWATLAELLDAGVQLVVFSTDPGGDAAPWLLDYFAHAWETKYAYETPDDMDCAVDRGSASNALFVLNHFLTNPVAKPDLATMVNQEPFLSDRIARCQTEAGQLPNFVTVDFYEIGSLFDAVRTLNGQ